MVIIIKLIFEKSDFVISHAQIIVKNAKYMRNLCEIELAKAAELMNFGGSFRTSHLYFHSANFAIFRKLNFACKL